MLGQAHPLAYPQAGALMPLATSVPAVMRCNRKISNINDEEQDRTAWRAIDFTHTSISARLRALEYDANERIESIV